MLRPVMSTAIPSFEPITSSDVLRAGPDAHCACRLAVGGRGLELAFTNHPGDRVTVQQLADALVALLEPYLTSTRAAWPG